MNCIVFIASDNLGNRNLLDGLKKAANKVLSFNLREIPTIEKLQELDPDMVIAEPTDEPFFWELAVAIHSKTEIPLVAVADGQNNLWQNMRADVFCGVLSGPMESHSILRSHLLWLKEHFAHYLSLRKDKEILKHALDRALKMNDFYVKSESRYLKLHVEEILSVEALKDYVIVHTLDEQFTIHTTMKEMELKLPAERFVRVHRSHIVHVDKISIIEGAFIQMEGGRMRIPIGGSYKEQLYSQLNFL